MFPIPRFQEPSSVFTNSSITSLRSLKSQYSKIHQNSNFFFLLKQSKMGVKKLNNSIELSPSLEDDSPIRAVFCLKNKTIDMKKIEELEDCFILDFDPSEPADFSTLSLSKSSDLCDDKDVSVLAENGQVACRDFPHPRHLCVKFPFEKTPHESHCKMCYCYVCEMAAPCKEWTKGLKHCDATNDDDEIWKLLKAKKTEA